MEIKYNDSTFNRPWGERPIDAPMVPIDIAAYIQQLNMEEAWQKNDHNAITVFKSDTYRLVLVGMHKEAQIETHLAEGIISVQVIEGKIKFSTESESVELGNRQMVVLHERILHSVTALEESFFLLSIVAEK